MQRARARENLGVGRLFVVIAVSTISSAQTLMADEVDDILALKVRNHDRVRRFSADFTVETDQPRTVPNPKTMRFRYHVQLEKLPRQPGRQPLNPWRAELEVLEPGHTKMRVEGDAVSYQQPDGTWVPVVLSSDQQAQINDMLQSSMGPDPHQQRERFAIRVVRQNNPIFGPKTRTVEYVSKGKTKLFARMEEDVDGDGLPLSTRLFDDAGHETVRLHVTKHRMANGIPVMEAMEAVSQTPAGEVVSRTACSAIQVESEP